MTLPMPSSVEDIARVVVAADDAYTAHLAECRDSPCLNCDSLAGLLTDGIAALREALPLPPVAPVGSTPHPAPGDEA